MPEWSQWVHERAVQRRAIADTTARIEEHIDGVWKDLCSCIDDCVQSYTDEFPEEPKPDCDGKQPNTKTVGTRKYQKRSVKLRFDRGKRTITVQRSDERHQNGEPLTFTIGVNDSGAVGFRQEDRQITTSTLCVEILDSVLFPDLPPRIS